MDITPKEKKKKSQIASGTPLFISLDKLFEKGRTQGKSLC